MQFLTIDKIFHSISYFLTVLLVMMILGIFISLTWGSSESISAFGFFGFLTSSDWNPAIGNFGAIIPVVGTLVTSGIALTLAFPVSMGVSFYITELAHKFIKIPLTVLIELLAVVPSIIFGMWGLFILAPTLGLDLSGWLSEHLGNQMIIGNFFKGASSGINVLTASLVLSLMIIPFMVSTFKDAFELVPRIYKESAYGLGCTTWEVMWHVVIPYTRTQILGGGMLALCRALGETMAVAFVIGNAYNLTQSVVQPGNTIASALANEFTEAESAIYTSALVHLALILFIITAIILAISQVLLRKLRSK